MIANNLILILMPYSIIEISIGSLLFIHVVSNKGMSEYFIEKKFRSMCSSYLKFCVAYIANIDAKYTTNLKLLLLGHITTSCNNFGKIQLQNLDKT